MVTKITINELRDCVYGISAALTQIDKSLARGDVESAYANVREARVWVDAVTAVGRHKEKCDEERKAARARASSPADVVRWYLADAPTVTAQDGTWDFAYDLCWLTATQICAVCGADYKSANWGDVRKVLDEYDIEYRVTLRCKDGSKLQKVYAFPVSPGHARDYPRV